MKQITIAVAALTLVSCGVNSSKPSDLAQITKQERGVTADSSEVIKFRRMIKGQWNTKEESIVTSFFDNFSVSTDAYGSDTSYFVISYKSCESDSSTKKQTNEIIYLKFMSKNNGESCFSIENLNDTSLTLMSLANGNIWSLTKRQQ